MTTRPGGEDARSERELAAAFMAARPRLLRVAYSIGGGLAAAEDAASECWLRLRRADAAERIADVEAWCVVAVARIALDDARSARARREEYVGPWLPEPLVETAPDPADRVTLDEQVSYSLLVVLDALSPAERTAWLLHDVFGLPFAEVAVTVGRTPAAVRKLASKARSKVREHEATTVGDPEEHRAAVTAFALAAATGDVGTLLTVLDPGVVCTSDGGGVVSAARRPVIGADHVARFILGLAQRGQRTGQVTTFTLVNGLLGAVVTNAGGGKEAVLSMTVGRDGRIARIDLVRNPMKLGCDAPGPS